MNKQQVLAQTGQYEPWFNEFVASIRSHQVQLESGIAPDHMKEFYNSVISGDLFHALKTTRGSTTEFFVKNIVRQFVDDYIAKKINAIVVALSHSDSEVRIWAVTDDNDYATENMLFDSEASINAKFHQYGFYFSVTIVEASDGIAVPSNFQIIIKRGELSGTSTTVKA